MRTHKPPVSAWIAAERKRRGWKVEELSQRLRAAGFQAEVGTVRVWEAGRAPRQDTIEALERLFESAAPRELPPVAGDLSEVVAAIREQTAAIADLAGAIREDRERLSPEAVTVFLRQLVAEGLIAPPEAMTSIGEPLTPNAGR